MVLDQSIITFTRKWTSHRSAINRPLLDLPTRTVLVFISWLPLALARQLYVLSFPSLLAPLHIERLWSPSLFHQILSRMKHLSVSISDLVSTIVTYFDMSTPMTKRNAEVVTAVKSFHDSIFGVDNIASIGFINFKEKSVTIYYLSHRLLILNSLIQEHLIPFISSKLCTLTSHSTPFPPWFSNQSFKSNPYHTFIWYYVRHFP